MTDADNEIPKKIGELIQAERLAARDAKKRRISQPAFYRAIQRVEREWVPDPKERKYADVTPDLAKKKIGKIEASEVELSRFDLELFAVALGLPRGKFVQDHGEPATAGRIAGSTQAAAGAVNAQVNGRRERGFRRIWPDSVIPACREPTQAALTAICGEPGSRLIVVEGRTGAGKSFFLSHWFARHGVARFGVNAMMLDASKGTASQVLLEIADHLGVARGGQSAPYVAETLSHLPNYLLILDGLRASSLVGKAKPNAVTLSGLREGLFELLRLAPNLTVVLCVENNGPIIQQHFFDSVGDQVEVEHFTLAPLTPNEGAQFMARLLNPPLPFDQLRQISDYLQGMPLALTVAAAELTGLPERDKERYAAHRAGSFDDLESEDGFEQFKSLIFSYLARLEADGASAGGRQTSSVHALLRLLALMPGPTSITHLDHLLEERRIIRLEDMKTDDPRLLQVPFLVRLDGKFDVHALVRRIFRSELDGFVRLNSFDEFTNQRELEWIHWRSALMNWTIIKQFDASGEADGLATSVIEAFVYHIVQLIRLTPKDRQRRRKSGGIAPHIITLFEEDIRKITDVALWDIAYYRVVQPFLLEKKHRSTRIHGQYDVKARVLEHLVRATDAGVPIAPLVQAEIHKEIAVCLMHGGHIHAARHQAELATSALSEVNPREGGKQDIWRGKMEIESVITTVDVRLGRMAGLIAERLAHYIQEAETQVREHNPDHERVRVPPGPAGALRVFARMADIDLQRGHMEAALRGFARADDLQMMIRNRRLDGEAARKYVVALARSRAKHPEHMEMAHRLVEANIGYYRSVLDEANTSSDLIPFLLQQASLFRIEGRIDKARELLSSIDEQEYVRKAAYTFMTGAELEFEELRLRIVEAYHADRAPEAIDGLADDAKVLVQRLSQSHHALASMEAELLHLEALPLTVRRPRLGELHDQMRLVGWTLRLQDIAELRRGGSAVQTFGL